MVAKTSPISGDLGLGQVGASPAIRAVDGSVAVEGSKKKKKKVFFGFSSLNPGGSGWAKSGSTGGDLGNFGAEETSGEKSGGSSSEFAHSAWAQVSPDFDSEEQGIHTIWALIRCGVSSFGGLNFFWNSSKGANQRDAQGRPSAREGEDDRHYLGSLIILKKNVSHSELQAARQTDLTRKQWAEKKLPTDASSTDAFISGGGKPFQSDGE
ncbi:hypothetical protein U1Q18_011255, partial [Sarracenia purpurea var. burkii]